MPTTWQWYQCCEHQDFIEAIDEHRKRYGDPVVGLLSPSKFSKMFPSVLTPITFNGATLSPSCKIPLDETALLLEIPDGKESVEPVFSSETVRHGDIEEGVDSRRQSNRTRSRKVATQRLLR